MAPPPVVAEAEAAHVFFIASHRIPPLKEWQIIRIPTIFGLMGHGIYFEHIGYVFYECKLLYLLADKLE